MIRARAFRTGGGSYGHHASAATPPEALRGDARQAYEDLRASGIQVWAYAQERLAEGEVVVDALLGTGLRGPARDEVAHVIRDLNCCGRPVLAVDVPSGLDSDTGVPLGETVRADCTVTFVGLKTGLFIADVAGICRPRCSSMTSRSRQARRLRPGRASRRILESAIQQALPRGGHARRTKVISVAC